MSLLLLFNSAAAAAEPAPVRVNRNTVVEQRVTLRTTAKAAAALLLLLQPAAEITGSLEATLGGLTSSAQADVVDVPPTVLRPTLNVSIDETRSIRANRSAHRVLFLTSEVTADLDQALQGLTLEADGSSDIDGALDATLGELGLATDATYGIAFTANSAIALDGVTLSADAGTVLDAAVAATLGGLSLAADATLADGEVFYLKRRKLLVIEERIEIGRRYQALFDTPVTEQPPFTGALTAALGELGLSTTGTVTPEEYDLFLGGDNRLEAQPAAAYQLPKRRPHLGLPMWYETTQVSVQATLGSLTLASQSALANSGALASAIGGLTLESLSGQDQIAYGALASILSGLTLASSATSTLGATGAITVGGLTLASQAATEVLSSLSAEIGGLTLASVGTPTEAPYGFAEITIGGLDLTAQASTDVDGQMTAALGGIGLSSFAGPQKVEVPLERTLFAWPDLRTLCSTSDVRTQKPRGGGRTIV